MDVFGLTGDAWMDVKLKLSPLAYNLLVEEFPLAKQFAKRRKEGTFFVGPVRHWKGIGRFVLGLPGEIEVIAPEELRAYLKERAGKWKG
jgi:proteasome accessory factor C